MLDIEPITLCRIVDRLERPGWSSARAIRSIAAPGGFTSPTRATAHRETQGDRCGTGRGSVCGIDPKDIEITRQVLARARENAGRTAGINRASNQ